MPPPLRFLALVAGLWICGRAAVLAPDWWRAAHEPGSPLAAGKTEAGVAAAGPAAAGASHRRPDADRCCLIGSVSFEMRTTDRQAPVVPPHLVPSPAPAPVSPPEATAAQSIPPAFPNSPASAPALAAPERAATRWSGSAWLLVRAEPGGAALAPGGTLGGSQAGARLLYRLAGGLALSGRLSAPLARTGGGEAAAGLDWRPAEGLPLHLLAERRQAIGRDGRSAFALTVYGGGGADLPHGLRAEAYGQAGIVGARARDPFVDAAVRIARPFGPVGIGGAIWGAAQPGLSRVDAGPSFSYRLPVQGANLRLQADWRFRLAGEAAPGSGPALSLAADF